MATETERRKPVAIFMAFGTKGDVNPIAAVAAGFACDQKQYHVILVTHSTHQTLGPHLAENHITFIPVSSPPILSAHDIPDATGSPEMSFSLQKRNLMTEHRQECYSIVERIFGEGPSMEGDFIVINFFALEGWSLAELFGVRCIVSAPYIVPYSAPSSFARYFKRELRLLYEYLIEAPDTKVSWKDVVHWMWPLFTDNWGTWRSDHLNLSPCPFTDPVTGLPTWHDRPPSPLVLYGFSKEAVECPDYWPLNVKVCGFWFLPIEWQFSCKGCREVSVSTSSGNMNTIPKLCSAQMELESFLKAPSANPLVFIGLSSVGSMGFLKNPPAFLQVLQTALEMTNYRFILFTASYEPLDSAARLLASSNLNGGQQGEDWIFLFDGRLFCFSGTIPYNWLFPRCAAAIHHGGSGSTAAALQAGIPQVLCPFMLDQFYWAERMFWLGVSPEPLKRSDLLPDTNTDIRKSATVLSRAIYNALSPEVKARAMEIAGRISFEDGVSEAVKILKEEMRCSN